MTAGLLALDAGTSMVKAVVLTDDGTQLATASEALPPAGPDGADQLVLWRTCASVMRAASRQVDAITAVVVTGQGDGLWTVDDAGEPTGPAPQWNSVLGAPTVADWEADGTLEEHYRASGTVLWAGASAALWRWLVATDPARADRVRAVMTAKDWINFRLTGRVATDLTDASIPFLDLAGRRYDPDAPVRLGCADIADRLPPLVDPGQQLGQVHAAAAEVTGIPAGTPVHMGCLDVVAMARGAGLRETGDAMSVLGTTAAALTVVDRVPSGGEPTGATIALPGERYLRVMGSSAGTATLEWWLGTAGYDGEDRYDRFWSDVESVTPDAEIFLPYLSGERVPFVAPEATGVFLGLTPATTREAMGRAVATGVSMALRSCLDAGGAGQSQIVLTGGGSTSPQWSSLVADVTGRTVVVDDRSNLGAIGAASLVPGWTDVARPPAATQRRLHHPSRRSASAQATYQRFLELVPTFRAIWRASAQPLPQGPVLRAPSVPGKDHE